MNIYNLYHKEREWAKINGDPILKTVESVSKEKAQKEHSHLSPVGVLAVMLCPECKKHELFGGNIVCEYCNDTPTIHETQTGVYY